MQGLKITHVIKRVPRYIFFQQRLLHADRLETRPYEIFMKSYNIY